MQKRNDRSEKYQSVAMPMTIIATGRMLPSAVMNLTMAKFQHAHGRQNGSLQVEHSRERR